MGAVLGIIDVPFEAPVQPEDTAWLGVPHGESASQGVLDGTTRSPSVEKQVEGKIFSPQVRLRGRVGHGFKVVQQLSHHQLGGGRVSPAP